MAHELILQPNGLLAVYSTIVDSFITANLTADEAVKWAADEDFAGDLGNAAVWVSNQIAKNEGRYVLFWRKMDFIGSSAHFYEYDRWGKACTQPYNVGERADPLQITLKLPVDHIFLVWEGTGTTISMHLALPPFLSFESAAAYVAKKHHIGIEWKMGRPMMGEVQVWEASPGGEAGFNTQYVRIAEAIPVP